MSPPDEWTDADFVPREPGTAEESPEQAERERMEWCRREIRSRLGAGESQAQVIGWLVEVGCDPGVAARLVAWAQTAAPLQPPGGGVICVEERYESGEVNTDPVASARARLAARKRAAAIPDAPAPEFEFAQPADSAQSRLTHQSRVSRKWLVLGVLAALLFSAAVLVIVL